MTVIAYPVIGRKIALAYDELERYNPAARASWDAMARDERRQFDVAGKNISINAWRGKGRPYLSSADMRADVQAGHLWVFEGGNPHPCRAPAEVFRGRAVHDIYAHAASGANFGPDGELEAFIQHARAYSPEALPALACDNLGQTAWYYFHPVNEGRPHATRVWPEQKVDFLPEGLWRGFIE
jgi:hypothetical protein